MSGHLIIPLDGSQLAEAAVPWAASLARTRGYSLVLAQALRWPPVQTDGILLVRMVPHTRDSEPSDEQRSAKRYLDGVGKRLVKRGVTVETVVREGPPGKMIMDLAEELGADAVVMATHGRGGLTRAVLGSVAEYVVRHATIPVLLIHRGGADATMPSRDPIFERLLVPLDGSSLAERAMVVAAEVASPGTSLILVRVEESARANHVQNQATGTPSGDHGARQYSAREYLEQVAGRIPASEGKTQIDVRVGAPADQILAAAREHDVDAIVMVTHGRTGLTRWWLGSVADTVVVHADRPVFLVTARGLAARVSEPYRVVDVMTRELAIVRDDESLASVLRTLLERRVPSIPVVNGGGKLVGMVSDNDLLEWHASVTAALASEEAPSPPEYAGRLRSEVVASIMTRSTPTIEESASLAQAIELFRKRRIDRVAVRRDGRLVGILSKTDVLKAMAARLMETEADAVENA